ncbi:MAG: hypothetical protein WC449_01840 [Candidatus Paceibacterota bacterium]
MENDDYDLDYVRKCAAKWQLAFFIAMALLLISLLIIWMICDKNVLVPKGQGYDGKNKIFIEYVGEPTPVQSQNEGSAVVAEKAWRFEQKIVATQETDQSLIAKIQQAKDEEKIIVDKVKELYRNGNTVYVLTAAGSSLATNEYYYLWRDKFERKDISFYFGNYASAYIFTFVDKPQKPVFYIPASWQKECQNVFEKQKPR